MSLGEIKLSIIVPIYNVEKYLAECLDSILIQQLGISFEVILVNDGSTDKSIDIATNYALAYPKKFILIEQKNQGLSAARNSGLDVAKGDYVLFLDSDDCLEKDGLPKLIDIALTEKADVVVGNFIKFFNDGTQKKNKNLISIDEAIGQDWLQLSLEKRKYMPAVWFKLYRREFLTNNKLYFVFGLINEDQVFSTEVFLKAKKITAKDVVFYRYRVRPGSISTSLDKENAIKRVDSDLHTVKCLIKLAHECESKYLRKLILGRLIKIIGPSLLTLYKNKSLDVVALEKYIKEVDKIRIHQYLRIVRFSQIIDWILLKKGFMTYLKWRS